MARTFAWRSDTLEGGNDRSNFSADSASQRRFVKDQYPTGLFHARQNCLFVQRRERAQIDDFNVQPFLLQFFARIECGRPELPGFPERRQQRQFPRHFDHGVLPVL